MTRQSGNLEITRDGTVLENAEVSGTITVARGVSGVVIRNVRVVTTGPWGIDFMGVRGLVEDVTVIGGVATNSCIGDSGRDNTFRRLDLSGSQDGIKLSDGAHLIDSYVHDLVYEPALDPHNDAVQFQGTADITVTHNALASPERGTSAILMGGGEVRPGATNILISANLLSGGGWTFYGPAGGQSVSRDVRVIDNQFSTVVYPKAGYYGAASQWEAGSGNVWQGNVWADGPNRGRPVQP